MADETPQYALKLARLLELTGLNQLELAKLASVDQSAVSHYLAGRREPGKFAAVIFAGLSPDLDDKLFWLQLAGVTQRQRELLAASLGVSISELAGSYENELIAEFLQFWKHPDGVVLESFREMLRKTVFAGIQHPTE